MYRFIIRPFVRKMKPEKASRVALHYFKLIGNIPGERFLSRRIHNNRPAGLQREVFGLDFYNPLGLGAGLDIKGELYNDLNDLGFSFVEIGPLRSENVREAIRNIQNDPQDDILAACIDKDHLETFSLAYDFCDFFVIDVTGQDIETLMNPLLDTRIAYGSYKPLVVKIPEDMGPGELDDTIDFCRMYNIDGIEARTIDQVKQVFQRTQGRLPVIANCHTETVRGLFKALSAGAALVEVRSGLIYKGPEFITRSLKYLQKRTKNEEKTDRSQNR